MAHSVKIFAAVSCVLVCVRVYNMIPKAKVIAWLRPFLELSSPRFTNQFSWRKKRRKLK